MVLVAAHYRLASYVGFVWDKKFGASAIYARRDSGSTLDPYSFSSKSRLV
jgi:uncharacterized protein involved in copper resistance